jgi:hypothetical protein
MTLSALPSVNFSYIPKDIKGTYIVDALQSSSGGLQVLEMPLPAKPLVLQKDQFSSSTSSNVATPTQPVQVKILKTVDNLPASAHNTNLKKPFKPPALLLVALEAAGLGMLWFTGDYLGKVAYNNYRSTVVAGSTIPFDRLEAEYQAVKNVMALYAHRNNQAYVSQVEGNWMSHANNLLKLSRQYLQSPNSFYGIATLQTEQTQKKILKYLETALAFYNRNGHQQHQVQIANLIVAHQLAIPIPTVVDDNAYNAVKDVFSAGFLVPRQFWTPAIMEKYQRLTSDSTQEVKKETTRIVNQSENLKKTVKSEKSTEAEAVQAQWRRQLLAEMDADIQENPASKEYYTKLMAQLVNLEKGLGIIQQSTLPSELPNIKPLQTMLLEYHHQFLLSPLESVEQTDKKPSLTRFGKISSVLLLEKVHFLASQAGRLNEVLVVEQSITQLLKQGNSNQFPKTLNAFINSDMQLKDSVINTDPNLISLLNQWALGQLHGIKQGDTYEVIAVQGLLQTLCNNPHIDRLENDQRQNFYRKSIREFYQNSVKSGDPSAGFFTLRMLIPLVKKYFPESGALSIKQSEGVYADSRYRYDVRQQMIDQLDAVLNNSHE